MQNRILFLYIIKKMLSSFAIIGGGLLLLIVILDFVELLNKMSDVSVSLSELLTLEALKITDLIQSSLPYIALFSFMHGFYKLNVSNEISAARSAGFSIFQVVTPVAILGAGIGVIFTIFINNFAILTYDIYLSKYDKHHNKTRTLIEVTPTGVWLREKTQNGVRIINGAKMNEKHKIIENVNIIELENNQVLANSYSADTAQLQKNNWVLKNAYITNQSNRLRYVKEIVLSTDNTLENLQKIFDEVNNISFWDLPDQIKLMKSAGLNTAEHKFMYFYLLSMPLLFVSLAFLAAYFCAQPFGRRGQKHIIIIGVLSGFGMFFYLNFVRTLVFITPLPPEVLGILPALSALSFSIFLLLSAEKTRI